MTYARGSSYECAGAVVDHEHRPAEDVVTGRVKGRQARPYDVAVRLSRSSSGAVTAVDGDCSCPVGHNCKHVAAVLLASRVPAGRERRDRSTRRVRAVRAAPGSVRGKPAWQTSLEELVSKLEGPHATAVEPELGLQFELMLRRPGEAAAAGIQLRPVTRTARGTWLRGGISWSKLEYQHSFPATAAERLRLLRELHAVSRLSGRPGYHYSYGPDAPVWLEDVASRRLWDLLRQAEELCIPLVSAGAGRGPVRLLREPAVLGADLCEVDGRLRVRPCVRADGELVPLGSCVPVGRPPHGIAWWPETGSAVDAGLVMGPFTRHLSQGEQALLSSQPVEVPQRHRGRFLREVYPRLARAVTVLSSDETVALPEPAGAVLVLSVRHDGQRSAVTWQRGEEGSSWRTELSPAGKQSLDKDLEEAVAQAIRIVRSLPGMVEDGWWGERLAPESELSGMDAVRFVTELLPALADVVGLVVEASGEPPDYRAATGPPVVSLRGVGDARESDWFDLRLEVTVDGEEVLFEELFVALAEGRSHLVLPSGTYFALDRPELAELAQLIAEARTMQDRESAAPGCLRLSRFQAGLWEDLRDLGVLTGQAQEWEAAVRALADGGTGEPPEAPAGLAATLRDYQHEGFSWLASLYRHRLGGILADDMGLGKTLQALSLVCHARQDLGVEEPFLVVAPTSVVANWASECRRFAPELTVATVTETGSRRWTALSDIAAKADLVVTSYTLFRLEYEEYARIGWAGLFLDEAQFVKNGRSIANLRCRSLPAPFKMAMTGTPIENNLRELWALLAIVAPGLFPRADRFVEHYAVPIEKRGDAERLSQLRRRIRPLMVRRTKAQVESELPPKQEQVVEVELAPAHRRRYLTLLQRERQKILGLIGDMDRNRFEILRSLTLLRQAALDVSLVGASGRAVPSTKLDLLMEMLGEIVADGHRVLVFSQFTRFLATAAERATRAGIEHCYLDGRTRRREQVISSFRQGNAPVFFISLKAGGFGLNLTEADYCVLLDPWWNPATEAQAVDRAHRIGQTRKVIVYRFVATDTIEEKVMALKAKKAALVASVMDAGGFEGAALSAADIRSLLE